VDLLAWIAGIGGAVSILFSGGYALSHARRRKDRGEALKAVADGGMSLLDYLAKLEGTVAEHGAALVEVRRELAEIRADHESLKWSVKQEDAEVSARIFTRADEHRKQEG
jgi:hypothetical protein